MTMPHCPTPRRLLGGAVLVTAALALAACGRQDDRSAGEKLDATIAKTEQAAADAKVVIKQDAREAEATLKAEAADAKTEISAAADRARTAAAEATAKTSAALERSAEQLGDKAQDAGITASVNAELAKDGALSVMRIDVDTVGGQVSLRGSAPSALARDRATRLAKSVKGVVSVDNQLAVRG